MGENSRNPVAVLGCGGWGTALAVHLTRTGCPVRLWGRDSGLVRELAEKRLNPVYLPDVVLPALIQPVCSIEAALSDARYVIVAVPSHGVRELMRKIGGYVDPKATIVSAVKGLEEKTLLRMSQFIQ